MNTTMRRAQQEEIRNRRRETAPSKPLIMASLTPLTELEEMVRRGWGETPQCEIPADWRERFGPDKRRKL